MIIVVIIFSLIYVILLTLILMAYYKNNHDLEIRVLQLEKKHKMCEKVELLYSDRRNIDKIILGDEIFEKRKDGDGEMACKKGRGGRKK